MLDEDASDNHDDVNDNDARFTRAHNVFDPPCNASTAGRRVLQAEAREDWTLAYCNRMRMYLTYEVGR